MREYVFRVRYQEGVDPVSDLYIQRPDVVSKCVSIMGTGTSLWCVTRIRGPQSDVRPLVDAFVSNEICNECLYENDHCTSEGSQYQVIDSTATEAIVYSHHWGTTGCFSVPFFAAEHLGEGILFDTLRRKDVYEWRILVPDDRDVGKLYDALKQHGQAGITVSLDRISTPARWGDGFSTVVDLPAEQRRALEAAVELGYYESPRRVTTDEVADELGVPGSTLRYRLRRAEGYLLPKLVRTSPAFAVDRAEPRE